MAGATADDRAARTATRLLFLVAGFVLACWAPLVPYAKQRLGVDDGVMGMLFFVAGLGSFPAMLSTGALCSRFGIKKIVVFGCTLLLLTLPFLAISSTTTTLGIALLVFGGSLGALDVAMNVHAVDVECAAGRPLMSGFHALFSVGGFAGAGCMTLLLINGMSPAYSTVICSCASAAAITLAIPRLLPIARRDDSPHFAMPHGAVLLLAGLASIMFLVEGAILDWTAVLITEKAYVEMAQGGLGYMLFAIAMTLGRFGGDWATARLGDLRILTWGGVVAVAGFVVLLTAPPNSALLGLVLIGLGAANIVPVFFRRAGSQQVMAVGLAVAAVSTAGYTGTLVGPALVGFVSRQIGLSGAYWVLCGLVILVPVFAQRVIRSANP